MIASFLAAAVLLKPATLTGTWNYRAFDAQKRLVASGTLKLGAPKPGHEGGVSYTGSKDIRQFASSAQIGPHGWRGESKKDLGELARKIDASFSGTNFLANLNAGMADNNIFLNGTLKGDRIEGTWSHSTFAGPKKGGAFVLTRRK